MGLIEIYDELEKEEIDCVSELIIQEVENNIKGRKPIIQTGIAIEVMFKIIEGFPKNKRKGAVKLLQEMVKHG